MAVEENGASALEGMPDEEYDRRITQAIGTVMDRIEESLRSDDAVEAELLYAAAPSALRNLLAHFIAEECVDQPRPYKLVKETVRDLDLEGLALAVLKDLQAEDAKREGGAAG